MTTTLKHLLRLLLRYRLVSSPQQRGFTLIELLVALIISTLVVSGLLTFVNSVSQTERRELVKANAQQEIQDATDFIVRDLQEAVYIYDAVGLSSTGLAGIADNIPPLGGAGNLGGATRCDSIATCRPVLAFWKRRGLDRCDSLPGAGGNRTRVGIVTGQAFAAASRPSTAALDSATECQRGDNAFVYSLVVYYLIRDPDNNPSATWSRAARIGRFEIRDGVVNPTQTDPANRFNAPAIPPDPGYLPFNLGNITADTRIASIDEAMRAWKSDTSLPPSFSAGYTPNAAYAATSMQILADFIDDTPTTTTNPTIQNGINVLSRLMPIPIAVGIPTGNTVNPDDACADPNRGAMGPGATRVPRDLTTAGQLNLSSFYACVSANRAAARVYLRGNALARLRPRVLPNRRPVTAANVGFLPTAEARVYGRGFFVPIR
ncbi:MAG: hormogonium polysaccharide secretion pseudopilin HpsC [Cyanobacteria bacterium]|nr:hormogonium polysaccharide secretion pseudopilin HpsC [Cyanobacteriota bacterium]MDW8200666.1 hormogonium polysaccharide secretion pseudopilin HpsC [Cyanobacteriota bacterium SKYGB_h_bin112]